MIRAVSLFIIAVTLLAVLALPALALMSSYNLLYGSLRAYFLRVAVGIDQLGAALLGWNEDMTISGHIGVRMRSGEATTVERWLCAVLTLFEANHCTKSIEEEDRIGNR